jgi:hypothetical protein
MQVANTLNEDDEIWRNYVLKQDSYKAQCTKRACDLRFSRPVASVKWAFTSVFKVGWTGKSNHRQYNLCPAKLHITGLLIHPSLVFFSLLFFLVFLVCACKLFIRRMQEGDVQFETCILIKATVSRAKPDEFCSSTHTVRQCANALNCIAEIVTLISIKL